MCFSVLAERRNFQFFSVLAERDFLVLTEKHIFPILARRHVLRFWKENTFSGFGRKNNFSNFGEKTHFRFWHETRVFGFFFVEKHIFEGLAKISFMILAGKYSFCGSGGKF